MLKRYICRAAVIAGLSLAVAPLSVADVQAAPGFCPTAEQAADVRGKYAQQNFEGAPIMIVARMAQLPEATVAASIIPDQGHTIAATPELVQDVWRTVDAWGADTMIHYVHTMGGLHVADFTTNVPILQPYDDSGLIDMYADGGDGVHAHIHLESVAAITAAELPSTTHPKRKGTVTRTISFYGHDGKLIAGLYASLGDKKFDQRAVDGFAKSYELVKSNPALCN